MLQANTYFGVPQSSTEEKAEFEVAAVSKSHGLQHGRSKRAKALLDSKSPVCTLSQNGYSARSVRFGSISGDTCQVQFQRWRGLHPMKKGRKKHRGSKQAGDKHV